jgi:hypothetical protein
MTTTKVRNRVSMPTSAGKTQVPVHRAFARCLLFQLGWGLFLACLVLAPDCSGRGDQSAPLRVRPTLTQLVPNTAIVGSTGTLILRGANFVPDVSISTPPGLDLRKVRVNSPAEITADYTVASKLSYRVFKRCGHNTRWNERTTKVPDCSAYFPVRCLTRLFPKPTAPCRRPTAIRIF